jgi:hypothetical protein
MYFVILVVMDIVSKYTHFIAMVHPYTTIQVAQVFAHYVFKLHGLPEVLSQIRILLLQANFGRVAQVIVLSLNSSHTSNLTYIK